MTLPDPATLVEALDVHRALLARIAAGPLPARAAAAATRIVAALQDGRPLLVCGNGGSAADASHIAGELVGRFLKDRRALRCQALVSDPATLTAIGNDMGFADIFARQVEAYGEAGGVLWGLSTSGNSQNVLRAFEAARARGMTTLAMTGAGGGKLAPLAEILLDVPERHVPAIQQAHQCLYHWICAQVEAAFA